MIWRRHLSTGQGYKKISIVGSGPAGFFTAYHLLNKSKIPIHVTVWEKLPTPFGLSRYGVAPDHPEVKNCEETFTECARKFISDKHHKFEFIGGVEIGNQIKLKDLLKSQDAVVLSYGCTGDKKLHIPGETDTSGVFSSRNFVNWYNGHPDIAQDPKLLDFEWSKVKNIGIIGNGNVAMDIARILLSNRIDAIWKHTDISSVALECLRNAPIENVKIIGRRDFVHSKFTNKELRELWQLERYGIFGKIDKEYFHDGMFDLSQFDRAFKRRVEMCSEYLKPFTQRKKNFKKFPIPSPSDVYDKRTWELDYLLSPIKINKCPQTSRLESLTLSHNKLALPENKVIKDEEKADVEYPMDLLITSLGYAGIPLEEFNSLGIGFERGHVANKQGRVLTTTNDLYPKLYASGWIRKGSQGVIASTMEDAFEVGDRVIQDLFVQPSTTESFDINLGKIRHTTWADWERINRQELKNGKEEGKKRTKFLSIEDIMNSIKS